MSANREMSEREGQFRQLVAEFPDSPMGHFSLGRLYLEEQRWAEAAASFECAARLDPSYAAALVGLGDAWVSAGDPARAREAWARALRTPLGQKDLSLQADLEQRMAQL